MTIYLLRMALLATAFQMTAGAFGEEGAPQQTQLQSRDAAQTASPQQVPALLQDPMNAAINQRLQDALRERDAIIRNLLERVQELEWRVNGGFTTAPKDVALKPTAAHSGTASSINAVVTNAGYDAEERQASQALDQALIVRGGLLLPPGTIEIDHSTSYFSSSADHLSINGFALLPVLVVGDITSQRTRKDLLLPTFTARLGLPHKLQFEAYIPYGYELNRTVDTNNVQTSQGTFGMGDITFGLSRQLTFEHGRVPDLLANVRFKTTTGIDSFNLNSSQTALGTGFYAVQGNLTAAKSNDPVVFFGNLSYTANLNGTHQIPDPQNVGQMIPGHFEPGDAIGFQLGSILALNPETSMTIGWDQRFTRSTTLNGQVIPASYLVEGSLRLGASYMYAPGRTIDLSFGVGLTPDTPNLQFSVGLPFRRALWGSKSTPH
ncbi:transporter [Edaphobacter flagellatus]|uniref:transporter n=1 Tax=Edaphobacter flagellatus TaxID=1933044 RepID=UPI0021B37D63|nr:transporter [Edaphobacter flagellatus]